MIYSKNLDFTPSIKTFINQRMGTVAKLFKPDDQLLEARIEVGRPSKHHRKGLVYYAEINLKIGSRLLRAAVEHADLRTAIDFARDEVERQVKKIKSKQRDFSRRPSQ